MDIISQWKKLNVVAVGDRIILSFIEEQNVLSVRMSAENVEALIAALKTETPKLIKKPTPQE